MTASHIEVLSTWTRQDWLGAIAVRCAYQRMQYTVQPGLYTINSPGSESPVFVSANYKLSFDHLRRALEGIAAWILVLDTKGINVWCAAGKGSFGTEEIIARVAAVDLKQQVSHRQLIVPQLGAPGVCAHEVQKQSGFRVTYGPVRALDIPRFLEAGAKADAAMRRVHFPLVDRLAIVPVEVVGSTKKALIVACLFGLIANARQGGVGLPELSGFWQNLYSQGLPAILFVLLGYVAVSFLTPILLPWLPGRAFSVKGAGAGLLAWLLLWLSGFYSQRNELVAWLLLYVSMGSFMGLNLTGASTYTSLSGVKKETRLSVPVMIAGLLLSLGIWLWSCLRMG